MSGRNKGAIGRTFEAAKTNAGGKPGGGGGGKPQQPQPKPVVAKGPPPARVITWTKPTSAAVGTTLDIGTMAASATGTGGTLRLEYPAGPFKVGQVVPNLKIVAPGDGVAWSDGSESIVVPVTPTPRTITAQPPAAKVKLNAPLGPTLFGAVPSAGPGAVEITAPAGKTATDYPKQRVVLSLAASGDFAAAPPVTFEIDVELPKRVISWSAPDTHVYGDPLDLKATATGEGGDVVIEYPQGPLAVGQTGINLKAVAQGKAGAWDGDEQTKAVVVTPRPRTLQASVPKPPFKTGAVVTASTFRAKASEGDDLPVVTKPPGGRLLQAGDTIEIELTLAAGNYAGVVKPLTVKVAKGVPKLKLTSSKAAAVLNDTVQTTWLTATVEPVELAGALVFTPAIGAALTQAGQVFLSVQFPGNADFERTDPVDVRITVAPNASEKDGAEDMNDAAKAKAAILAKYRDARTDKLLLDWDNDVGGIKTTGKEVMTDIQCMTSEELIKYMDKKVGRTKSGKPTEDQFWELGGGLQVRYKAKGDAFSPSKHYCMEVSKVSVSKEPADIAFKITLGGVPAPVGKEAFVPGTVMARGGTAKADYLNGIISMTHPRVLAKRKQVITWPLVDGSDVFANEDVDATVWNATAVNAVTYKIGKSTNVFNKGDKIMFPSQNGVVIKAFAAANEKYDEGTESRTVNVKRRSK